MTRIQTGETKRWGENRYNPKTFLREGARLAVRLSSCTSLEQARTEFLHFIQMNHLRALDNQPLVASGQEQRVGECARVLQRLAGVYGEKKTGFSVTQALWDVSRRIPRPDLTPAFFGEVIHLILGLEGRAPDTTIDDYRQSKELRGRKAALLRSDNLDSLWEYVEKWITRYANGLNEKTIQKRKVRRKKILSTLGGTPEDWTDWRWHVAHVVKDAPTLAKTLRLPQEQLDAIDRAVSNRLPFGATPFYLSLMDEDGKHDQALRAQVFPPANYVDRMLEKKDDRECCFDFMGEIDTSPIHLITRRYPAILILKPYNTCPQICVYCQRNWEIDQAMAPDAMASSKAVNKALDWISAHPAIKEVLITGGDPLLMEDDQLRYILDSLTANKNIERIRIGTRIPVTLPFRITDSLVALLESYRKPGVREICVVTHVQHPYEINPDMVQAVEKLRRAGIHLYNQLVFTFFISRRFEASALRRILRLVGIDPYYTFNTKGKEETEAYRVPVARLLQEMREESRLMPGLARTDKAVYNVPRLGKNHLRASENRSLLTVLADGSRVYEWHPWEKNIALQRTYIGQDVPILEYLQRLDEWGENPNDYLSIWYYF